MSELREIRNPAGESIGLDRAYHTLFGFDAFEAAIFCPLCHCTKSGDADVPNRVTEACADSRCACHEGIENE
jgi:hypothetical protein